MTSCAYSILVVLTALLVTISQFTSTILISDFSSTNITKSFESITVNYNMLVQQDNINFAGSAPSAFWRFAEKTEPPTKGDGIADTGPSLRGMIPWADASRRRKLRFYEGPAVVLDARVACIRPGLSDTTLGDPEDPNGGVGRFLRGNITLGTEYAALGASTAASNDEDFHDSTSFGCMLGVGSHHAFGSKGTSSICEVRCPQSLPGSSLFNQTSGSPYLIVKTEGKGLDTDGFVWEELVASDRGVWKSFSTRDDRRVLSLSVCFAQSAYGGVNVTMRGLSTRDEPTIAWNPSLSDTRDLGTISTLAVREHFGVTNKNLSLPERGVMSLDVRMSQPVDYRLFLPGFGRYFDTLLLGFNDDMPTRKVSAAHDTVIALFEQITDETDNPAYAMQTLFTILFQMQYYDRNYAFGAAGLANYDIGESVSIPVRWTGLCGTLAILALHLFVVFTTLALFLARTEVSLLGNYWPAVAQVVSDDTAPLLKQADGMRDKEVKKLMKGYAHEEGVLRERRNRRREFGAR
ncbi:uncharacterized protein PG986_012720 [Apiospora aurea]|uniref:Uncharacterized protein n=1 Tax=Apiospora aurea TaxID=335848 RepID=A0ABR1Q0T0_9PEZI